MSCLDYKYKHPLYTKDDGELALNALTEYIENNNRAEQVAVQGFFEEEPLVVPKEISQRMVVTQYGCNLITIANYLNMQDLFFTYYMPHWIKYLDNVGIQAKCQYCRLNSFILRYIIQQCTLGNMQPLTYWDPSIFWMDYSYGDDKMKNLANPLNNFYRASLQVLDCDNYDFIITLDKLYGKTNISRDKNTKYTIDINVLPANNPVKMIELTKVIHRYL